MRINLFTRRTLAILLSAAILSPLCSLPVLADSGPPISIEIGQPSVWSLGQAHYLLEKMHRRNRKLSSKFPTEDDLDPNRISASRIDALRSSLGIEGQFDQALGTKNSIALRRLRESDARRDSARTDSLQKQAQLAQVNNELTEINQNIALLEEENRQSQEARERETPVPPPTAEENQRRKELVLLKVNKTRKEEQRKELKDEITALNTTADATPATPTLEEPAFATGNGALPSSKTFDSFMEKALREAGKPDLSASMKLNNFIQGQYEIIANQLTLLRDEVGPDDRVVFLELPASIYTVDKKADNYVAQVEWEVTEYCDKEPPAAIQTEVIQEELRKQGKIGNDAEEVLLRIDKSRERVATYRALDRWNEGGGLPEILIQDELQSAKAKFGSPVPYPITLEMIKRFRKTVAGKCTPGNTERVRAIDIIPRQSALNVNEYHATVKETMILAAFKLLIGFAGKVSYQRQRELYEQFVQQQVFASGYGRGGDKFGWTYGPQPGTKRISPGEKTTFAVLVVPRNTLALELKARARFYKRDVSPKDPDSDDVRPATYQKFFLSIPGKRTQEFWIDGISYSPVKKGKRITAVIDGNFFSPQLGILINGVPLEPSVSITRTAGTTEEAEVQSADGVVGEYEITSPRQIILSFAMGDGYVGTPTITITSPEKTTPINFFDLTINHRRQYDVLQELSVREPMFIEDFNDKLEIEPIREVPAVDASNSPVNLDGIVVAAAAQAKLKLFRVKSAGLRPEAEIWLNNEPVPYNEDLHSLAEVLRYVTQTRPTPRTSFAVHESTKSYLIYTPNTDSKWKIAYRHLTRQGYEEGSAVKDFSSPNFNVQVQNYRFLPGARRAEVDLNVLSKQTLNKVELEDPRNGRCLAPTPFNPAQNIYRVKCYVPADNNGKLERSSILIKATVTTAAGGSAEIFADVPLPVKPQILSLFNPRTSRPEGFATEEPTIVISGANLQGVTGVFFGSQKGEIAGVSEDSIAVKAPKVTGIPKGEAVAVPIILQTAAGQIPSGAIYTYKGEPLPPNVIVWPGPPRKYE